ncbi:hypothetical protein LY90DRAFT_669390 [Neocallimastix californiae]|uniref:F-box domain-containing protein n=1 Tax=Neocallimastix californiae TaxID=1754190 RepID=A0A1Y2DBM1_9FUNG|nr:hypothetical protein LY90DRAFT_669390 [Neocallimastix californiae]|eukprot:ORY56516.1 hypothetical protein LY90DRAFT_669390 [Neocallimastix californiae]
MIIKKSNNDEIDSIEEKKLFDNKDHANSSSNLMFGSLNILKTCKLPNNKGKEISSSSLEINNNSESNCIKELTMKKLNIVSTIDHSVISSNDNYTLEKEVEKFITNSKHIINNVLKSNKENQNVSNTTNNREKGEIHLNIDDNINKTINSNHTEGEGNSLELYKMNKNFFNDKNDIQQSNTSQNNSTKLSNCNLGMECVVENLENADITYLIDSKFNNTNPIQKSQLLPIGDNILNNENKKDEKKQEVKSNEYSIRSSYNSLNSVDSNTITNLLIMDDSFKKTTGESNKIITKNKSSSSESLVEKSLNNNSPHKENLCLKVEKNIYNNSILENKEISNKLLKINSKNENIFPVTLLISASEYNSWVSTLYNIKTHIFKLFKCNTFFVNSKLNNNIQNIIFLKQFKPKIDFINYGKIIQVSVDCRRFLNLISLSSKFSFNLVPLKHTKSFEHLSIKFKICDSEKLSEIALFLWNLSSLNIEQYELSLNAFSNNHYHKISALGKLHNIKHIQWHIQKDIDNEHALSCSEYLSYLWILYQFKNDCDSCQIQYLSKLNNNKCLECQNIINKQIKNCKKCHILIKNIEYDKINENESMKNEKFEKNSLLTEIKEIFIPRKKEIYKLDTLPPEILMNIFDQFTKNVDKQNFRFTCKRFRKTLDSPNVLMIKKYEQLNYLKNLINIKKAIMNIDIFFKDYDKLEITNNIFNEIRNLVLLCDIQDMILTTSEYSKKLINTLFNSFNTLTNLTIRRVNRRDIFTRLFSPRQLTFPSLINLQFEECVLSPRTLKPWEKISMPSLKSVTIDEKSVLSHIPSFLRNLCSIELKCHFKTDLWISGEYYNLENLIVELDYKDDLNELFIKEGTYMPNLKSLVLMNNKKIESLPISPKLTDLTLVCDEFSKEELNRLSECYPDLSVLNIECPLDFSFPSNFTSLKSLRLEFIPTILIRTIPALPHLTSLHIERGEHVVLNGVFPELKYLIIESCDKINFTGKFEALEWIKFRNCNNIRTIDWDFPSLNSLSLENCFFLTSIEDKYPLLQTLNVKCCKNFYKIPSNLSKLNALNILQCDNFISVSSNFKSLTILNVSHCRIFSYVPKELDNLEWLLLEDCNNIHQIPHLSKLRHFKCLRCKNIPFPFSPCKFFPNIRSFAVTTLNKK